MKLLSRLFCLCILASITACNENHIKAKREGMLPVKDGAIRSLGFEAQQESLPKQF